MQSQLQRQPRTVIGQSHVPLNARIPNHSTTRRPRLRMACHGNNDGNNPATMSALKEIMQEAPHDTLSAKSFTNANFPLDVEGRTLHLGTRKGEVANRILSVGSMDRALLLADLLDPPNSGQQPFQHLSSRGFLTVTGSYRGIPISVVSTQMGFPNIDFVVRECRAVVDGQMAIVRLGTCGGLQPPARLGCLIVASKGAICIRRDPDAITLRDGRPLYTFSQPVAADAQLSGLLLEAASARVDCVHGGMNATADSFYSSQGRVGGDFDDANGELLQRLARERPEVLSLEMETFHLLDLARCSKGTVRAAAFAIVLAERDSNRFIDHDLMKQRELQGGMAALEALSKVDLKDDVSLLNGRSGFAVPKGGYVWASK